VIVTDREEAILKVRTMQHVLALHRDFLLEAKGDADLKAFDPQNIGDRFDVQRLLESREGVWEEIGKLRDRVYLTAARQEAEIMASRQWMSFPGWWLRWKYADIACWTLAVPPALEIIRTWQDRQLLWLLGYIDAPCTNLA
jgi:hypothetical protein